MQIGEVIAKFTADVSAFKKGLKDAESSVSSVGKKMTSVGKSISKAGAWITAGVTVPLIAAGVKAFKWASDLNETINKVDVAFGNNAAEVLAWGETTLKTFGMSKSSALDMAATFGDMGTSMGLTTGKAAEMAMGLSGLAGDLASFKNIPIEEASTALTGVFTGETESLKRLGIVMLDANLATFAQEKGMKKAWKEMSQAEKVAVRYQYILDKTKNSQGDFARTSDGAANQMRTFQESVKELGAELGENLIPIITPLIQKLNDLLEKWKGMSPEMQQTVLKIVAVVAAIGPLVTIIGSFITAGGWLVTIIQGIGAALSALAVALGISVGWVVLIIAAIVALIAAGVWLWQNWDMVKAKALEVFTAIGTFITNWYTNNLLPIFTAIGDAFTWLWESLIKPVIDNIVKGFQWWYDFFSMIWNNFFGPILEIIGMAFELVFLKIWHIIEDVSGWIWDKIKQVWNAVWGFIQPILNTIATFMSGVWNSIKEAVRVAWEAIKTNILTPIAAAWDELKKSLQDIWDGVNDKFNAVLGTVKDLWGKIKDAIVGPISDAWNSVSGIISKIHDGLKDALDLEKRHSPSVMDKVREGVRKIKDAYSQLGNFNAPSVSVGGMTAGNGGNMTSVVVNMAGAYISSQAVAEEYAEQIGDAIMRKFSKTVRL
jgi:hypothetical protein